MLDKTSIIPLYSQIAEVLKNRMITGEIKPGDMLDSESKMIAEFGVGRLTVRNALAQLVEAGFLEKVQGKGTFCKIAGESGYLNIEVLLDMGNTYFIPTYYVKGISEVFTANNCNFIISDTNSNVESLCSSLEGILLKNCSGVIFQLTPVDLPSHILARLISCITAFNNRGIPCVMIDSRIEKANVSYVMLDEFAGGVRVAEHFSAFGHKKCAVAYRANCCDALQRYNGFCKAARDFKMATPIELHCEDTLESELLCAVRQQGVTGIFGYNDDIAVRCIRVFKQNGITVPDQVSVIGFDDSYLAITSEPQLTTISHPKEVMGKHTARALLKLIRRQIRAPYTEMFYPELIRRNSCAIVAG